MPCRICRHETLPVLLSRSHATPPGTVSRLQSDDGPERCASAGGLATKLGVLDATLRAAVADRGAALEALLAPDADPLQPARLRLTANDVRRPA